LVLSYIDTNPPRVYMCSPSWTPLPPPSPSHPSGSSQCTSPKHPVSCMEPGLQSVSHMIIYMFQCHSPISSHPHPPGYMLIRKGLSVFLSDCGLFYGTFQLQQRKLNSDWVNLFIFLTHTYTQRDVLFQWINKNVRDGFRNSWIQVLKVSPESSLLASSIFLWVGFTLKQVFSSQCQDGCHESQAYRLCSKLNQKKASFPR